LTAAGDERKGRRVDLAKEWEVARDVLAKVDDRILDIRKVSLGFVTTLLTADTFILHQLKDSTCGVRFGVVLSVTLVTALLIVAARLAEKQQELLQEAVVERAQVIERLLGPELSDVVRVRFQAQHWFRYGAWMHVVLVVAVGVIAAAAAGDGIKPEEAFVLFAVCLAAVIMLCLLQRKRVEHERTTDWSLDRIECKQGESVRILVTNVSSSDQPLYDPAYNVVPEEAESQKKLPTPQDSTELLAPGRSRLFTWCTKAIHPGTYVVYPSDWHKAPPPQSKTVAKEDSGAGTSAERTVDPPSGDWDRSQYRPLVRRIVVVEPGPLRNTANDGDA
jgi:hypothetical protein